MRRFLIAALFVCGMCLSTAVSVSAEDAAVEKKAKAKKAKVEPVKVTIRGLIAKTEQKKGEDVIVIYILTDADGKKTTLRKPKPPNKRKKKKDGDEPAKVINLDDYLDVPVDVTVLAIEKGKKDKKSLRVRKIISIEKVAE